MNRRQFLRRAGAGTLLAVSFGHGGLERPLASSTPRPNLVFIMADDHALEAVSAYGSHLKDYARTPHIDRLAREGMRFTNCCCNNSICSPSRASILTGQYTHVHGVHRNSQEISRGSPWFSVALQQAGYDTAVVGKWHLADRPKGFAEYWIAEEQGTYFDPALRTPHGMVKKTGYATDVYTDLALDWLNKRRQDRPFCLCLHLKSPHIPFEYAPRHADLFENVTIPEPPTLYEDVQTTSPLLKSQLRTQLDAAHSYYDRFKGDSRTVMAAASDHRSRVAAAYQHLVKKYLRCVAAIDENVGRVLAALDDLGLSDDTVVVYTSDQGYLLGQHGLYDKRLILEESLKMPLLVRYPKEIAAGAVNDDLVMNVDFAPTFLDYAGVPVPAAMQGRSLRPLLQGMSPNDWRDAVFYAYWDESPAHWGMRTARFKIVCFPQTEQIEFYDLQADPREVRNVAGEQAYAHIIAFCRLRLTALMREVGISRRQLPRFREMYIPESQAKA